MRVLVVSESAAERSRATSALELLPAIATGVDGIEVVEETAALGVQARRDLDTFDVLVIDGDLRPKGGFSLLYELRASADLDGRRHVPAIVMVERGGADHWLAGWARADQVVDKPVDPFALARGVAALGSGAPA